MKKYLLILILSIFIFDNQVFSQEFEKKKDPNLASFHIDSLLTKLQKTDNPWLPFMIGENVLAGIYTVKAGTEDRQRPHNTDEIYYVVQGKAKFKVEEEVTDAVPGSIIFVKAAKIHSFFEIEEDLVLLVFFDQ